MNMDTQAAVVDGHADALITVSTDFDDAVPRIRDVELGARLGYCRVREVRALIKELIRAEKLSNVRFRGVAPRNPGQRGRVAPHEFWLTEEQALFVIAKSGTSTADAILREVITVFVAWRHGRLAAANSNTDAQLNELFRAIAELQRELIALRSGVISREVLNQLRADVRRVAALECAARRWHTTRAATSDVYREIGQLTAWGGKGQPWKLLPAPLAHTAFTVLRGREASIRRELNVLASDRQIRLEHVPDEAPAKPKKPTLN